MDYAGDYRTFEQELCPVTYDLPAETCLTIGSHWGWHSDDRCKSYEQILEALVRIVGHGSNLLLNISPRPNGSIPPPQLRIIERLGSWLKRNGAAIYATVAGPLTDKPRGATTISDEALFILITDLQCEQIVLPGLADAGHWEGTRLLDGASTITAQVEGYDVRLQLPEQRGDEAYIIRCDRH